MNGWMESQFKEFTLTRFSYRALGSQFYSLANQAFLSSLSLLILTHNRILFYALYYPKV